jgi:hypothetical protein
MKDPPILGLRNIFKVKNLSILRLGQIFLSNNSKFNGFNLYKDFQFRLVPTYFWGWFESLFSNNFDYLFILMLPMGENMNKGTISIVTLVIILDYIQM